MAILLIAVTLVNELIVTDNIILKGLIVSV